MPLRQWRAASKTRGVSKKGCSNCGTSGHKAHFKGRWICPSEPKAEARFTNYTKWVEQWEAKQQAKRDEVRMQGREDWMVFDS